MDETTGELDDQADSNNQDRTKILATVAATVMKFTSHFPDMPVIATGSNQARTRLYQMGIASNLKEIETTLEVYGLKEGNWHQFRKNVNYEAFFVTRRKK